jgi:ribosomal protein S18 acetylase RimI-like enzyme
MAIEPLGPDRCDALLRFFAALPEGDLTFIREEVHDPETVRSWASGPGSGGRWVAVDTGGEGGEGIGGEGGEGIDEVTGYVAVRPLPGWSDHVGEIRLVVAPSRRGSGLGRELARRAVAEAIGAGLTKLVVEVVAEQGAALALFTELGFTGEALLVDHIRDRNGDLRDLMVLAHHVRDTWAGMDTVGVVDELSSP